MVKVLRLLILLLPFAFTSCEKKFLEIVPVTEKVEDLSIPNAGNIKLFSFPSSNVGYAASDTNFIYKTIDGGKSWQQISFNSNQVDKYSKCKKLEFYDEQNGVCYFGGSSYLNAVLVTNNGGASWAITEYSPLAGITTGGKAYTCKYDFTTRTCMIRESNDKGKTFKNLISLYIEKDFKALKVIGSSVYVLNEEGTVHGYNPVTADTLRYYIGTTYGLTPMNDFLFTDRVKVAVGSVIKGSYSEYFHTLDQDYYDGTGYYSVDAYQDFILAAGRGSIVTNMDTQDGEKWHEVFDQNGNGFDKTFYKIKFIDDQYFLVSGEKGLIWKMKI